MAPPVTDYTKLTKFELRFAFCLITSLFFIWGLSYGLVDVLNSHFLGTFDLTFAETTMLQFAYFVSYLFISTPMSMFMGKFGYKLGIHIGLGLYATGAILYWPAALYHNYGMFVAFTFICGSGLATLEVAASSYLSLLGPPQFAARRLVIAQTTNGLASVIGPLIAAYTFFHDDNNTSLGSVQYLYLAMALFATALNVCIYFAKLPEVQQAMTAEQLAAGGFEKPTARGFLKKKRTIYGALAEFAYVGAQVSLATLCIQYVINQPGISPPFSKQDGSNMLSGCQATFTVARFIGIFYLRYVEPKFALFVNGCLAVVTSILAATIGGKVGIAFLFATFFFEGICYPVILATAIENLGLYNKIGAGLVTAAVSGGACWPALMSTVAQSVSYQKSMFIIMIGYIPLATYGGVMWVHAANVKGVKLSIWQTEARSADVDQAALDTPLDESRDEKAVVEGEVETAHTTTLK